MASLVEKIHQRIDEFRKDKQAQEKFNLLLDSVSLADIIWPENNPDVFGDDYLVKYRKRNCPFPLWEPEHRLAYIEERIQRISREETVEKIHPAQAFYLLTMYQVQFKPEPEPTPKKAASRKTGTAKKAKRAKAVPRKTRKSAAALEEEPRKQRIYRKLQRLKNHLSVSPELKKAKTEQELLRCLFDEFEVMTAQFFEHRRTVEAFETELELYRKPDYMHPSARKAMEEVIAENAGQRIMHSRELVRVESLEREIERLLTKMNETSDYPSLQEELTGLRREYRVLSSKNDSLVNNNIKLSNRLKTYGEADPAGLERILDAVRDRINAALKLGDNISNDALVKSIEGEIGQVRRAREYLGRALYDVGVLYLRMGERDKAIAEFRAARELGVEDADTNRLLNH